MRRSPWQTCSAAGKVLSVTVEELCHYHPMGVYYYVEKKRGG